MAPPASCDDSAKAGAMSDLKKQLLQVVFWQKNMGKIGLELGE